MQIIQIFILILFVSGGLFAEENANPGKKQTKSKVEDTFKNEPKVKDLQKMAIDYAAIKPGEFNNWLSKARMSNLLPELEFKYRNNQEEDESVDFAGTTLDKSGKDTDDDHRYEFRAKWRLSRLIYSGEEPGIAREVARQVRDRENIVSQVTRLYFQRRKLQIRLLTEKPDTESELLQRTMQVKEYTALLDGLTGGKFSKNIKKSPKKKK